MSESLRNYQIRSLKAVVIEVHVFKCTTTVKAIQRIFESHAIQVFVLLLASDNERALEFSASKANLLVGVRQLSQT